MIAATTEEIKEENIQFRKVGKNLTSKLGDDNTVELTESFFTDLRRGTGATVISSAGGMELAIEGDQWKNGLFTYALLNGLTSKEADLNNDGQIMLSELKRYVYLKVNELSKGRQQPTSHIENQSIDMIVW